MFGPFSSKKHPVKQEDGGVEHLHFGVGVGDVLGLNEQAAQTRQCLGLE